MKNIDTLLGSGKIRGVEAARLVIQNEVADYRREVLGQDVAGFSDAQINALVAGIKNPVDGRAYNLYINGFLLVKDLMGNYHITKQSFDRDSLLAFHLMQDLRTAECVYGTTAGSPMIMTRKQYETAKTEGITEEKYPHGIAVLEESVTPEYYIDDNGNFENPDPPYGYIRMAEAFFDAYAEAMPVLYDRLESALASMFRHLKAAEMIVEHMHIREMETFIPPFPDIEMLAFANRYARGFRKVGFLRYGLSEGEKSRDELKRLARASLRIIDPFGFQPSEESVEAARNLVADAIEKGDAAKLLAALAGALR